MAFGVLSQMQVFFNWFGQLPGNGNAPVRQAAAAFMQLLLQLPAPPLGNAAEEVDDENEQAAGGEGEDSD